MSRTSARTAREASINNGGLRHEHSGNAASRSTMTPRSGSNRQTMRQSSVPSQARRGQVAFEPQPQETPLNANAILALQNLKKGDVNIHSKYLKAAYLRAAELCRESVEQANERALLEQNRRKNRLEKHQKNGTEESEQEAHDFEEYQAKIDALNKRLEHGVRQIVTDKQLSEGTAEFIQHVLTKSKDAEVRRQQSREDNDEDDEPGEDGELPNLDVSEHATTLLRAAQSTHKSRWNSQSLTEKYSQDPIYVDFYRLRWDAQHPETNPPPIPQPSMWFAAEEGRRQKGHQSSQRQAGGPATNQTHDEDTQGADEDSDIELHAENVSCKCPLTLVWFQDPVSSTKCNHSFERNAIMAMLKQSRERLPLSDEQHSELNSKFPRGSRGRPQAEGQMRAKNPIFVPCPVCSAQLTDKDLRDDPVLLRRTKRAKDAQEAEARDVPEASDESDDEYLTKMQRPRRPQRTVLDINSSPATARRRTLIKGEQGMDATASTHSSPLSPHGSRRNQDVAMDDSEEFSGDEMSE